MLKGRGRRAPLFDSDDLDLERGDDDEDLERGDDEDSDLGKDEHMSARSRLLEKRATFVSRQTRMRTWALLRHPRCASPARFIPKDVCRIIARLVDPLVVVVGGGLRRTTASCGAVLNTRRRRRSDDDDEDEDEDEDEAATVLLLDWADRLPRWQAARRVASLPPRPFDARAIVPEKAFDNLITARDPVTGGVFVGAFRQAPVVCEKCRSRGEEGEREGERPHCCCCCPQFFFCSSSGSVRRLPNAHTLTVGGSLVVFDGYLYRIGGELLADHWVFDGCPTCNSATDNVERLCVAPDILSGEREPEQWRECEKLPAPRLLAAAVAVSDILLVIGGAHGNAFSGYAATSTVFELDQTGKWLMRDALQLPGPLAQFDYAFTI